MVFLHLGSRKKYNFYGGKGGNSFLEKVYDSVSFVVIMVIMYYADKDDE